MNVKQPEREDDCLDFLIYKK